MNYSNRCCHSRWPTQAPETTRGPFTIKGSGFWGPVRTSWNSVWTCFQSQTTASQSLRCPPDSQPPQPLTPVYQVSLQSVFCSDRMCCCVTVKLAVVSFVEIFRTDVFLFILSILQNKCHTLTAPPAPVVYYREFETPVPTLRLRRSANTLDPIR